MAVQQAKAKDNDFPTFKMLVLGDSSVGKTCLIHRFCDRAFYATYISTIGEMLNVNLQVQTSIILCRL